MMIVPSRKAIVLKAANPAQIVGCIPTAKTFMFRGHQLVYVPHGLDETKVLRNMGCAVPSPMQYQYDWPKKEGRHDPFAHQRVTSEFLTHHKRCAVLNAPRCVDGSTEYLSPTGWVRIAAYSGGTVAQYNQQTMQLEFVVPDQYHITPCLQMVHIQTRSIDQMLSPGHRVLLRRADGVECVQSAQFVHDKLQHGKTLSPWGVPVTFAAPHRSGLPISIVQLRVMVAVIADGHFQRGSSTNRVVMRLKRPRKVERLSQLLLAANIPFKLRVDTSRTGMGFRVFTFVAPRKEKDFSLWWECDQEQLQAIADEVLHWDGNTTTGRDRFSSFSKASADFVQYVFAAIGFCTTLKINRRHRRENEETEYVVQRHKNKSGTLRLAGGSSLPERNSKLVDAPDNRMYCFTVPSTFLVFRRNGHIFVSGNTGKTASCLWTADYLMKQGLVRKVLIISPLSTLERVWHDELYLTFWWRKVVVLYGDRAKRLRLLKEEADFYIVNHDGFGIIKNELPHDIDIIIYDEAAVMRNANTNRFRHFFSFLQQRPSLRLWLLTGTPTPNAPTDAWTLCKLLGAVSLPRYTMFRDMVMHKISTWSWAAKPGSEQTVTQYLQPSIRYTRDDCFDLPATMYETRQCEMSEAQRNLFMALVRRFTTEVEGERVTAVNEASKIQKLLQVLCISWHTPTLTDSGWKQICDVSSVDRVWDGVEWVSHGGAIYKGHRNVVTCFGVDATEDHNFLTTKGWRQAKEILDGATGIEFIREAVRLPDGDITRWVFGRGKQEGAVAMCVRLWKNYIARKSISSSQTTNQSEKLRMSSRQRQTQNVKQGVVSCLVGNEESLLQQTQQRLVSIRRAWHICMQAVEKFIRFVFCGYAQHAQEGLNTWTSEQQRPIFTAQLPLGNSPTTKQQSTNKYLGKYTERTDAGRARSRSLWSETYDVLRENWPLRLGYSSGTGDNGVAVYDLIDCGPRHRFVVLGSDGTPVIVHNCGVVYTDAGEEALVDCESRVSVIREVIEECSEKVLVFVPFTGALNALATHLGKHFSVAIVDGSVSAARRNLIYQQFQNSPDPRVIVANARTMQHGLDMTAATTVIWAGPTNSNETYEQACDRIMGVRQKHKTSIVHIEASDIERRIYKRLRDKQRVQGLLLELIQQNKDLL